MKLSFYGATREVTGSCYLLETKTKKILIDCGMFQGGKIGEDKNLEDFPFDPATIDYLLVTHSHLDHSGRIPRLVQYGFKGKIYMTEPTVRFVELFLEDSVHILETEARRHKHEPIFTEQDVTAAGALFNGIKYREPLALGDGLTVEFFDAGHILGSAIIKITDQGKSIVFSGDLGNPPVPILKPTEIIDEADYVVMESTYGGRIHEDKGTRRLLLQSAIYETLMMGSVLMIPAFAMERTQEILFALNDMVNNKDIPPIPIFLDSPLAIKATEIFKEFEHYFNAETREIIATGDDIFNFPGLRMTMTTAQSKAINDFKAPKIVIAGSGMAQGGRILHHIERYMSFFANQYLIVGFQVKGSLGRHILDGDKQVSVHGKKIDVKAKVKAIGGFSAHADQPKLTTWLSNFDQKRLKTVFLTHGEESQGLALQEYLKKSFTCDIQVPEINQQVKLK